MAAMAAALVLLSIQSCGFFFSLHSIEHAPVPVDATELKFADSNATCWQPQVSSSEQQRRGLGVWLVVYTDTVV